MLYITQVEYKMNEKDKWHKGWLIGEHIDNASTLLDENFQSLPKIVEMSELGEKEYICYDYRNNKFGGVTIQL